ncbi:sn-glycerol-3-phosphate ABC transporter permease UgpA [soil metagenome]
MAAALAQTDSEKRAPFKSAWLPYALVAPQLAITLVFFFWPAGQALLQSFQLEDAFGLSKEFVGLENFRNLMNDADYLASFKLTAVYSFLVAFLGLAVALVLAAFIDRVMRAGALSSRFGAAYKTLLIWPYAIAPALAGVVWLFLFNPSLGVVAHALRAVGIEWNHLLDADQALALIVMAAVWKQISYNVVFFIAGFQAIPESLLEAAAIDGAGPVRRFFSIVFPLLSPTTFFLFVVNVVYAFFDTFAIVDAATQGGPGRETTILVYKVYHDGFKALDLGSSSAQSVILMAIVIVLTVAQFRFVERRVNY